MRSTALGPVVVVASLTAACLADRPGALSAAEARAVMDRAVQFLLEDQNTEGSWGGPREAVYTFTGVVWCNPETHRSWKVGTTGLACLALLEVGQTDDVLEAADRAVDYLIEHAAVKRPNAWDTMNSWAYIYGLQALARAYDHPRYADSPRRARCRETGELLMHKLAACQAPNGGWGYLEFNLPRTPRQQWATSFTTAAAVVAMVDAQRAGFEIDPDTLRRAVRAVERCRLPSGAYTYSVPAIADPRHSEWIDQIKGSLGRIQECNLALLLAGKEVPERRLKTGLDYLFQHHRFLDIARNKPIPHENYYYNSGYFYLFGHYYAARVVLELPEEDQVDYWPRLRYEVAKLQQKDGSMWDYDMHAYHKPYGTAFSVLTLAESVKDAPPGAARPDQSANQSPDRSVDQSRERKRAENEARRTAP
jgi:hypothetical protein